MKTSRSVFGVTAGGETAYIYTLVNSNGLKARITNFGATLVSMETPDHTDSLADITLGYETLKDYEANPPYAGCTVGRCANRIAKGSFKLDGRTYSLAVNNGSNHLHGGIVGFHKVIWKSTLKKTAKSASVICKYISPDGEEGYPGRLTVTTTYTLTDKNELRIDYAAKSDAKTVVNLTNHSYWNLAGCTAGKILKHLLTLKACRYTPADATLIPTGEIKPVKNTPLDFTRPCAIGARFNRLKTGYDHNFVLDRKGPGLVLAAKVEEPSSGRTMEVFTTEPGIQLYTGYYLGPKPKGKKGKAYGKYDGFCLETQHYPDSINHRNFPSVILQAGKVFRSTTLHRFGTL